MRNKIQIGIAMLAILLFLCVSCGLEERKVETSLKQANNRIKETQTITEELTELKTEEPTIETTTKEDICKVKMVAVGDNLINDTIAQCGLQDDGTYEFSELYEEIESDVQEADLAVINQETILGGPDFPYSGYPTFNAPFEVGDALIKAGFDIATQATNHSMDMGTKGIDNCKNYWKKHPEIVKLGLNSSPKKQSKIKVIEKNGIKIALLNYTYGLNGISLPAGKEYLVNLIEESRIVNDIQKAEELADFTIVFPHWGVEYMYEPNAEQKRLANVMVENGADLIIGTHPHVLESIEWIKSDNGNKALCYYSLGNYTSNQVHAQAMLGGMAKLTIEKKGNKVSVKKDAGIIPLVTHYILGDNRITKTYRLTDYSEEMAKTHSIHTVSDEAFTYELLKKTAEDVVGEWIIK